MDSKFSPDTSIYERKLTKLQKDLADEINKKKNSFTKKLMTKAKNFTMTAVAVVSFSSGVTYYFSPEMFSTLLSYGKNFYNQLYQLTSSAYQLAVPIIEIITSNIKFAGVFLCNIFSMHPLLPYIAFGVTAAGIIYLCI